MEVWVHERFLPKGRKGEPIDVIAYEIDMWRRSGEAVGSKRTAYDQTKSPDDVYEYNLRIEGFLLHTRNLLAFFTDQHNKPTDLTIRQEWVKSQLREQVCSSLIVRAKKLDEDNRGEGASCYDEISKFLSHCTDQRYVRQKTWDIEKLYSDMDPILSEFEAAFSDALLQAPQSGVQLMGDNNSTASFRRFRVL